MEGKEGVQKKSIALKNSLISPNREKGKLLENVLENKQWRQQFLFCTVKNKTFKCHLGNSGFELMAQEEMKQTMSDVPICLRVWFFFFSILLSAAVGMNRSRSSWDNKALHSPVTRITRSSSSQVRHTESTETLESRPGPYGKQRKKQTDSVLAQDLSQMSVSGPDSLPARWGHRISHGKVTCRWNSIVIWHLNRKT